jgi:hypothetical protein
MQKCINQRFRICFLKVCIPYAKCKRAQIEDTVVAPLIINTIIMVNYYKVVHASKSDL